MKLLFLLVGSVFAEEWITESCAGVSYGYWRGCYGLDKSRCEAKVDYRGTRECTYQEDVTMEFTATTNGRWAENFNCMTHAAELGGQTVYSYMIFESPEAARDVCAAACDQNLKCGMAKIYKMRWKSGHLYSCYLTELDCTKEGVHWHDGLDDEVSVYQKTTQAAITNVGFTIAARTKETTCQIDANGCVSDGEGNYENDEKCWFWFTGNGSVTFEEFSLEEYNGYEYYNDYLYLEDWGTQVYVTGSDMLEGKTLQVSGFKTFGFETSGESTWPGFKVCPQVENPTPPPVDPATGVTCEDINDKKQCKQSLTCKYNKGQGCSTAPTCAELSKRDCKKKKNKKRCKLNTTKTRVDGKKVRTKTCVDK